LDGSLGVVGVSPFHEQIGTPVLDRLEPQSLVEPQRRIEPLDVDAQRLAGGGFGLEALQQRRLDPAVAEPGEGRDVDDADLVRPAGDVEQPAGSPSTTMMSKAAPA
jgi:hypothetical protein